MSEQGSTPGDGREATRPDPVRVTALAPLGTERRPVFLYPSQWAAIEQACAASGLNRSEWIRQAVAAALEPMPIGRAPSPDQLTDPDLLARLAALETALRDLIARVERTGGYADPADQDVLHRAKATLAGGAGKADGEPALHALAAAGEDGPGRPDEQASGRAVPR